jgi:hypothetical protein
VAEAARADRPALALAAILVLGASLRVWQLDALGFNSDETVYLGQGAALAGVPELDPYFPLFRAHPLLFQALLSIGFRFGLEGSFGRLVSAGVGLATVLLVFETGRLLYGRRAGLLAALLLAVMPYHVLVTRQVLLDGPMTLCATLTLYLVARYAVTERAMWLYAAAAALGLTTLAKETGIVLLGAVYAFCALSPAVPLRRRDVVISLAITAAVIAPYPLALSLAGETGTGGNFLTWQLVRPPNHEWSFYVTTVPAAVGPLVIAVAVAGLWILRRAWSWRETLLLAWIAVSPSGRSRATSTCCRRRRRSRCSPGARWPWSARARRARRPPSPRWSSPRCSSPSGRTSSPRGRRRRSRGRAGSRAAGRPAAGSATTSRRGRCS